MRTSRRVYLEELSVKEIHHLILERHRNTRHARLEQFHNTGKVQQILGEESLDASIQDARITLISCHPYLIDDHRIVVSAVLQSQ